MRPPPLAQDIGFAGTGFGTYVTCLRNMAALEMASVSVPVFAPYKLMKDPASMLPRLTAPAWDDPRDAGTAVDLALAEGLLKTGDYHLRVRADCTVGGCGCGF